MQRSEKAKDAIAAIRNEIGDIRDHGFEGWACRLGDGLAFLVAELEKAERGEGELLPRSEWTLLKCALWLIERCPESHEWRTDLAASGVLMQHRMNCVSPQTKTANGAQECIIWHCQQHDLPLPWREDPVLSEPISQMTPERCDLVATKIGLEIGVLITQPLDGRHFASMTWDIKKGAWRHRVYGFCREDLAWRNALENGAGDALHADADGMLRIILSPEPEAPNDE